MRPVGAAVAVGEGTLGAPPWPCCWRASRSRISVSSSSSVGPVTASSLPALRRSLSLFIGRISRKYTTAAVMRNVSAAPHDRAPQEAHTLLELAVDGGAGRLDAEDVTVEVLGADGTDHRIDEALHERVDDLAERGADDDRHSELDDVATQ